MSKTGGISSVGRALAWHARGQRFESAMLHFVFITGLHQNGVMSQRHLPSSRRQLRRFFYPYTSENFMAIEGQELAIACARAAEQIQAEDIRVIDLRGVSSLTDFMVVCSGTSLPHIKAVMRDVEKEIVENHQVHAVHAEGNADSRWVVLDYIDVMVHIMHNDLRELYGLEDLWAKGIELEWAD